MVKVLIIILLLIVGHESLKEKIVKKYVHNVVELTGIQKKDDEVLDAAVESLQKGKIIAVPTDTTYTFAAGLNNTNAIKKLYNLTGTPFNHSLAISIGRVKEIDSWGMTHNIHASLINQLLPGPVTILLERRPTVNPKLNPRSKLVGIRIPGAKIQLFIRRVANKYGDPLVLIPACYYHRNRSLSIYDFQELWYKVDIVFNIGKLPKIGRLSSTVVDLSVNGEYKIVREGIPAKADAVRSIAERYHLKDPSAKTPFRRGTETFYY